MFGDMRLSNEALCRQFINSVTAFTLHHDECYAHAQALKHYICNLPIFKVPCNILLCIGLFVERASSLP
jgi:hypothetical protein